MDLLLCGGGFFVFSRRRRAAFQHRAPSRSAGPLRIEIAFRAAHDKIHGPGLEPPARQADESPLTWLAVLATEMGKMLGQSFLTPHPTQRVTLHRLSDF